jgi:hypothetical protein
MIRRIQRNKLRAIRPRTRGIPSHLHIPSFRNHILDQFGDVLAKHPMGYCFLCGRAMKGAINHSHENENLS